MIAPSRCMRSKFFSRRTFYNLAGLSLLYGDAHVAAWNTHFPTAHEHLLWKISSSLASLFVPVSLLVYRGYRNFERYTAIKNHKIHRAWMNVATPLLYFYFGLGAPVFIAARVYLTVESLLVYAVCQRVLFRRLNGAIIGLTISWRISFQLSMLCKEKDFRLR